ncbi:thiamine-monophosphate kinase [Desulfurococcaceae archaeon MEX13E-LK6-19]|nr:thiamine-monophosphate kinase [Desulfurococcaceae archaeon MEX13E-LK6-19]
MYARDVGEEEIVRMIVKLLDKPVHGERLPEGDDARDITVKGPRILFSIDGYSIESALLPWRTLEDIGWAAVTGTVSDIVSKAGWPEGVMASIGIPREWSIEEIMSLMKGIREACSYYGVRFLGGDTNSSKDPWITVAAIGFTSTAYPPPRNNAKPGDAVIVTGDNYGAMGVVALDGIEKARDIKWVVEKTKRPITEVRTAGIIQGYAKAFHATMDVSDGLAYTIHTIAKASGVGIHIKEKPLYPKELDDYCKNNDKCIWERILFGGEEYGVVLVVDKKYLDKITRELTNYDIPFKIIGEVIEDKQITIEGYGELKPRRWDQFKGWTILS